MSGPLPGIRIGHWHDTGALTGCTVLLPEAGAMRAGVDVGGGAPGTRETDLLRPTAAVGEVHALLLSGGSAFGLAAATGVMRYLRERGIGYDVRVARVPIVPAAVIFDLDMGDAEAHPDAEAGHAACVAASAGERRQGNVGAGCGARVGNMLGPAHRMRGGLGLASSLRSDAVAMGALAVVNAAGDVLAEDGTILAGARDAEGFAGVTSLLRRGRGEAPFPAQPSTNTTLVAVVTAARLDKAGLTRLAQQAQDGLARAISPVHTGYDGDTVFTLSTGEVEVDPNVLAVLAAELAAEAIRNAVRAATGVPGVPAVGDLS